MHAFALTSRFVARQHRYEPSSRAAAWLGVRFLLDMLAASMFFWRRWKALHPATFWWSTTADDSMKVVWAISWLWRFRPLGWRESSSGGFIATQLTFGRSGFRSSAWERSPPALNDS